MAANKNTVNLTLSVDRNKLNVALRARLAEIADQISDQDLSSLAGRIGGLGNPSFGPLEKNKGGLLSLAGGMQRVSGRNHKQSGFYMTVRSYIQHWGLTDFTGPDPVEIPPNELAAMRVEIPRIARDWGRE